MFVQHCGIKTNGEIGAEVQNKKQLESPPEVGRGSPRAWCPAYAPRCCAPVNGGLWIYLALRFQPPAAEKQMDFKCLLDF